MQENGVMAYSNQEVPAKYDGAYTIHESDFLKEYTLENYSKYTEVKCYAYTSDADRSCAHLRNAGRASE